MGEDLLARLHQSPESFELSGNVQRLLVDVDAELAAFRDLGVFSEEVEREIRAAFLPTSITDTLTIEGYRVNPRITRAVLEGQSLSEADRYNEREILNIIAANELVSTAAARGTPLSQDDVHQIHRAVYWLLDQHAGEFRREDVTITGAAIRPPAAEQVHSLIDAAFVSLEGSSSHPIVQAAWIHWEIAAIHPFLDGNGRTARLTQDLALVRHRFLPVGIPAGRRTEYYDALSRADAGDLEPLVEIVANSELTNLGRARQIADAPSRRMSKVRALVRGAQDRVKKRDYLLYEVWRRKVDLLVSEFDRWIRDLNQESAELHFRFKVFDPISFETWTEMREKGHARNTWVFRITLVIRREAVYSFLFYARRHEWNWVFEQSHDERGAIGLFVTGALAPEFHFEFDRYEDPFLRLREVLFVTDGLRVFYGGASESVTATRERLADQLSSPDWSDRWVSADGASGTLVEHFVEDILAKFGLA